MISRTRVALISLFLLLVAAACGDRPEAVDETPEVPPPTQAMPDASVDSMNVAAAGLEAAEVKAFLDALRHALVEDDRARVAEMVAYPLTVTLDGETTTLSNAEDLHTHYEDVFAPSIREALHQQQLAELFANYQGVRIGRGEIWLGGVYPEEDADAYEVKIIAINHGAAEGAR